ncbi:MAG: hypothetical protein HZA17_08845 [Nitrospirae bacterium]|nr:hypothetical protein [Nitrospirota bacterium]
MIMIVCKDMEGVVPEEIQVIPAGLHSTPRGDFLSDEESARSVILAFNSRSNDMVVDYEHQTIAEPPVEAPAAGWIKRLINKGGDGIWDVPRRCGDEPCADPRRGEAEGQECQ